MEFVGFGVGYPWYFGWTQGEVAGEYFFYIGPVFIVFEKT